MVGDWVIGGLVVGVSEVTGRLVLGLVSDGEVAVVSDVELEELEVGNSSAVVPGEKVSSVVFSIPASSLAARTSFSPPPPEQAARDKAATNDAPLKKDFSLVGTGSSSRFGPTTTLRYLSDGMMASKKTEVKFNHSVWLIVLATAWLKSLVRLV